mgnify:CR=1 FL=1
MSILIRSLLETDYKNAEQILTSAFQRPGSWRTDLELIHRLQPDGLFLAEYNGVPAGMVTVVIYPGFAYVGMMAVHESNQHQGIGLALMENLLSWLEKKQVTAVKLDARPSGQHLYEKLGFIAQGSVAVYLCEQVQTVFPPGADVLPLSSNLLDTLTVLDTKVFGTSRGVVLANLLAAHPERAFFLTEKDGIKGYIFAQNSRIGPWVAMDDAVAEVLLQAVLSLPFPGPITATVPEENLSTPTLLEKYCFRLSRLNVHMIRGPFTAMGQRNLVYGQASLSLG